MWSIQRFKKNGELQVQLNIMLRGKPLIQRGTCNHENVQYEQCIVSYDTASYISTKGNLVI